MFDKLKPAFITFTGIDERTDLARVQALSDRYPVEWAVLFSAARQETDPRYPSLVVTEEFRLMPIRKAAHLCGDYAKAVVKCGKPNVFLTGFQRIQINTISPVPMAINDYASIWSAQGVMQVRGDDFPEIKKVQMLFDRSGGRGVVPGRWPRHPGGDRLVGYAGGIGPDNVLDVLAVINADGPYWIDMESGVRTDDWLDLDKCEAVLEAVYGKTVAK